MSEENVPAVATENSLATVDFGEYSGDGFENQTSDDMAIPFLGLLQDLSPQIKKKSDDYIDGAEPGMMFNTVTKELLPDTVHFVPCVTQHCFVEWVPLAAGGGFVGQHDVNSAIVAQARANSSAINDLKTEGGNELIETFYIYGLLLDSADATEGTMPIVIAFTSSKIKVYKRLMTTLRTIKGKPPLFAFRLAVKSKDETNKVNQQYSNFEIGYANGEMAKSVNAPGTAFEGLLQEGSALKEAVLGGAARAAFESSAETQGGGEDVPF